MGLEAHPLIVVAQLAVVQSQTGAPSFEFPADLRSLIINLLAAVIAGIAVYIYRTGITRLLRSGKSINRAVRGMFPRSEPVIVHIGQFKAPEFPTLAPGGKVVFPFYTPIIGLHDALGIAELQAHIASTTGKHQQLKIAAAGSSADIYNTSFFSCGGPFVNAVTRQVMQDLSAEFQIPDPPSQKPFQPVDVIARDIRNNKIYRPTFLATGGRNPKLKLKEDYGFIFLTRPNPDERYCGLTMFGLWPQGARAAYQALWRVGSAQKKDLKTFHKLLGDTKPFVAVVKTTITDLDQSSPELISVRPL
jgi:hypothetical protein